MKQAEKLVILGFRSGLQTETQSAGGWHRGSETLPASCQKG